jgi:transketolase
MPSRHELANAIRVLTIDAVEKAQSGHPGMPMGMADIAEVLWNDFLQHNPLNPKWINRDRFVISNGHGCMLLYALLHLTGYADMTIDDIKQFRELHSKTPGHPEYGFAAGIETTTGPLGQGLANAVGMAIAEKTLAAQFNQNEFKLIDHHTYVFLGDGCLMEGISHEVCSLAGTLGLGKLIAFYDDNDISIDGSVGGWFTDDTPKRFESYGWHVISNVDGHDIIAIQNAIREAQSIHDKPSLLCCKTVIGYGAPKLAGSHKVHSDPLGESEITATRENLGWQYAPFEIPDAIYQGWDARAKGSASEKSWQEMFASYQRKYPELAHELMRRIHQELPETFQTKANELRDQMQNKMETMATRKASQVALNAFGPIMPELLGGSADLTGSNCTYWSGSEIIRRQESGGNYLHYGVREFGMFAIMNGLALHGGFIPYGGTFLTFVDYGRNAIRLSAMMKQQVIYIFTHDSIGLGQDGPTHQPIEHLNMLRLTPNLSLWRPCDATETAIAWQKALENKQLPTVLSLTRQNVETVSRDNDALKNILRGGYIIRDCDGTPEAIIIATGSEVHLAIKGYEQLTQQGKKIRVISMPSVDEFEKQDESYKKAVLPDAIKNRVIIEAGSTGFWYKYAGLDGKIIGIDRFGESAPANDLFNYFGFTVENVVKTVLGLVG